MKSWSNLFGKNDCHNSCLANFISFKKKDWGDAALPTCSNNKSNMK